MNLSNKLTIARAIIAPLFLFGLMMEKFLLALVLFIVATLTDFLDGKIARATNQVTDFGKFLDPIADKVLTTLAFLYFLKSDIVDIVPVSITFVREYIVSAVRFMAYQKGEVVSASLEGKLKTIFQMFSIILGVLYLFLKSNLQLLQVDLSYIKTLCSAFLWISVLFSLFSGFKYLVLVRRTKMKN